MILYDLIKIEFSTEINRVIDLRNPYYSQLLLILSQQKILHKVKHE